MIILDENILESQRQLLRDRRIQARQIGHDIGRKGLKDKAFFRFLLPFFSLCPTKLASMPRGPHHVMVRALERRVIFTDDADREDFVARLAYL